MSDYNQNDNGLYPISGTFPQTNLSTDPQSEQRSGGLRDRVVARLGVDIPRLEIERIIPQFSILNYGPPETEEISGCAHATMMIFNNNHPHQPLDVDLPPQEGSDGIPTEESVYVTSLESNADPIGAPLAFSFDSEVVAETEVMHLLSLESGSKDNDKDKEYNQAEDKEEDHNIPKGKVSS